MKKILGLDLGTNSIGWALIEQDEKERLGKILGAGSRILPMSQDVLGKFDSGQSVSQTAERTRLRSVRRLRERHLLRRERLHRVLNILGFLPGHYAALVDFEKRLGQFLEETEPKIPYRFNDGTKKSEFIFQDSFNEMLADFARHQPDLVADGKKVPYDWTIYYLRKKALSEKIGKEELAWLLLNFNQKRGYYQLRGEEEEENINKKSEFYSLRVVRVESTDDKKGDDQWYNVHLENGWIYRRTSRVPLEWAGKVKDFIVTTELNEDGSVKQDKDGKERRSFRAPAEDDWTLLKKKTEHDIEQSNKTVGAYIYDTLLQKPAQKIRGKLVRVVERKFYRQELEMVLNRQQEFHPELRDPSLYQTCLEELYEHNEAHRNSIVAKGFAYLFVNDIIFYQRPLKSKKSLISNCPFESRVFLKDGQKVSQPLKCIAKSHPLFQEFRLWQFVQNLRIYQREKYIDGRLYTDVNVTADFLETSDQLAALFDWLNERKAVDQKAFLKYPAFGLKKEADNYRWNYVEEKDYPCNETKGLVSARLSRIAGLPTDFLDRDTMERLWHILYSVEDKQDLVKALSSFAVSKGLVDETASQFVREFTKFPPFEKDYGAYSAKAIKKLLPLMRCGKHWDAGDIDAAVQGRIEKLVTGEWDEAIKNRVREKAMHLAGSEDFSGLPLWLASYVVYNRHSEAADTKSWRTADRIERLEQHSLRNPIVEQVINETLQVVKDIWIHFGKGEEDFFQEIHIELGREMKNPAAKREQMSRQIAENEATNLRIKALLQELLNDGEIENVRPYSPMQQEILKIYEEGALSAAGEVPDYISKIAKQAQPSQSDLIRYKLWLQQRYRSPYTGQIIPLNKLFTRAYDIEHIIPQSRYFDDSLSNKVICEVEVNRDKDNSTAYEYIKNNSGKKIELSFGQEATLFTVEQYEDFVKRHYANTRSKMKKLLMEDIPEDFIQRQLNDSRYISKVVKGLLSNIVRTDEEEEATSKNVVVTSGAITAALKQDWGLNDVWNDLVTPRFERLNALTSSNNFGEWTNKEGKRVFQTAVPLELQKGFSKKRIDHRHHALDAIVIACATKSHVNYLNNESALEKGKTKDQRAKIRYDLKSRLCFKKFNDDRNYKWVFSKPWESFTQDAKEILSSIVVSFKQNLRVINKTVNYYQHWNKGKNGKPEKVLMSQAKGESWSVRKPMHKDTVAGLVKLRLRKMVSLSTALDSWQMIASRELKQEIKALVAQGLDKKRLQKHFKDMNCSWNGLDVSKVEVYYWAVDGNGLPLNAASRTAVNESFSSDKIASITDTGIQKIMLRHLSKFNEEKSGKVVEHPELAFSPDGIEEMNKNIVELNGGKWHQPILRVRTFEPVGNKFPVGEKGNKRSKYVEAAKGTNLFFAVYADEKGKRNYETIPMNIVIERLKQGLEPVPEKDASGNRLLFHLSPNDLVYVPNSDEDVRQAFSKTTEVNIRKVYKVVSFSGNQCFFIRNDVAVSIVNKFEFSPLNKMERSIEGAMIKESCLKLRVDRLGQVRASGGISLFDDFGERFFQLPAGPKVNKQIAE